MAELLIRAAMIDHLVVGDLLAPGAGPRLTSRRPLISHLVADAHVAEARPVLADHAVAAKLFRSLGDPMRLAIVELLTRGELRVVDLVAELSTSQPNVSGPLACLKGSRRGGRRTMR